MEDMKILVTGATGKVGSRLVPRFLAKGLKIRILVRDESRVESLKKLGAEVVVGDVNIPDTLSAAVEGIDTVVHIAGYFRNSKDVEGIMKTNHEGTILLAKAASKAGVKRFIFSSTSLVYNSGIPHPAEENDYCSIEGAMAYPASKIAAEKDLLELNSAGKIDVRIIRFGFVYGDGDTHLQDYLSLLPMFKAHPGQRLHLVHHLDIAQALFLLLKTEGINGEIFNVGDDSPVTYYEIAKMFSQQDTAFNYSYESPDNLFQGIMDTTKIRKVTGFQPLVPSLFYAKEMDIL